MRPNHIKASILVTKAWRASETRQIESLFLEYDLNQPPSVVKRAREYFEKIKLKIEGRFFGRAIGGGLPSDEYPLLFIQLFIAVQLLSYFRGMAEEAGRDTWRTIKNKILSATKIEPSAKSVKKWGKPNYSIRLKFKDG